jgi:hypothetical protein
MMPDRIFVADLSGEGDFTWIGDLAEAPARDDMTWIEYRRTPVGAPDSAIRPTPHDSEDGS